MSAVIFSTRSPAALQVRVEHAYMCADAFLRSAAWRASLARILERVRSRLHPVGGNAAPLLQPWREYGQQSGDARGGQSPVFRPTLDCVGLCSYIRYFRRHDFGSEKDMK